MNDKAKSPIQVIEYEGDRYIKIKDLKNWLSEMKMPDKPITNREMLERLVKALNAFL